jgi:hypothetical protein
MKDLDATLRVFDCEPPKAASAAMAKLRPCWSETAM